MNIDGEQTVIKVFSSFVVYVVMFNRLMRQWFFTFVLFRESTLVDQNLLRFWLGNRIYPDERLRLQLQT